MGSAGSTSNGVTVPPECSIAPYLNVTSFIFFNSTHNLQCLEYVQPTDFYTQGCLDSSGNWCDPDADGCSNCDIDYCGAGVPPQPLGYGPPDYAVFNFSSGMNCYAGNSAGPASRDVGNGIVPCDGPAGENLQFFGRSNEPGTKARLYYVPKKPILCSNGSTITPNYDTNFELVCTYDQGGNATCTSAEPLILPLASYKIN